jgi:hypothetical protein
MEGIGRVESGTETEQLPRDVRNDRTSLAPFYTGLGVPHITVGNAA